jgi:hypothetical protein
MGYGACHGGKRRPSEELFDTREAAAEAAKDFVGCVDDWRWEVEEVVDSQAVAEVVAPEAVEAVEVPT